MTPKPPISANDIPADWHLSVREAINQREGVPIRASDTQAVIEIYSINSKSWGPLLLPGGGTHFVTMADRNIILHRIQSK